MVEYPNIHWIFVLIPPITCGWTSWTVPGRIPSHLWSFSSQCRLSFVVHKCVSHLVPSEEGAGLELVPDVRQMAEHLSGDVRRAEVHGDGVQHLLPRPDPLQVPDRVTAAHLPGANREVRSDQVTGVDRGGGGARAWFEGRAGVRSRVMTASEGSRVGD